MVESKRESHMASSKQYQNIIRVDSILGDTDGGGSSNLLHSFGGRKTSNLASRRVMNMN